MLMRDEGIWKLTGKHTHKRNLSAGLYRTKKGSSSSYAFGGHEVIVGDCQPSNTHTITTTVMLACRLVNTAARLI